MTSFLPGRDEKDTGAVSRPSFPQHLSLTRILWRRWIALDCARLATPLFPCPGRYACRIPAHANHLRPMSCNYHTEPFRPPPRFERFANLASKPGPSGSICKSRIFTNRPRARIVERTIWGAHWSWIPMIWMLSCAHGVGLFPCCFEWSEARNVSGFRKCGKCDNSPELLTVESDRGNQFHVSHAAS